MKMFNKGKVRVTDFENERQSKVSIYLKAIVSAIALVLVIAGEAAAQSNVTSGLEGFVYIENDHTPAVNARVRIVNNDTQIPIGTAITDSKGYYVRPDIPPGSYTVTISLPPDYEERSIRYERASVGMFNELLPPQILQRRSAVAVANPTPTPNPVTVSTQRPAVAAIERTGVALETQRGGSFDANELTGLPLGGKTFVRSFDELAFLVPGVSAPPEPIGNNVGPGVGPGVGTSGQFSVNGLVSRANNFMVDGSDNNDEDIGVRRQGFFSLVPQPIESVQEFQVITLLAPAQYGRNLGGQINAISKSGTSSFHGALYGNYNSDRLNSRNYFDFKGETPTLNLQGAGRDVFLNGSQVKITNPAGGKDPLSFFSGGGVLGGPIVKERTFFFVSGEGQVLNSDQEKHFAVPTVEQRGFLGSGATGITTLGQSRRLRPTTESGNLIFSLFPFPNDPNGVYGRNTLTQVLSADARGKVLSGKVDHYFGSGEKLQVLTARYNLTDDSRELPVTGGGIFSSQKAKVRTDNFSAFLNGAITSTLTNLARFSWGRTRLRFDETRDSSFMLPSSTSFGSPFLLNAPSIANTTTPIGSLQGDGPNGVTLTTLAPSTEPKLGAIGQVIIGGFSPLGVDVFNFPQNRVNNTFQFADTLRSSAFDGHNLAFGADIRRTGLESDLPRNSRPLITFYGAPNFAPGGVVPVTDTTLDPAGGPPRTTTIGTLNLGGYLSPLDLAAAGAPTGYFQSLVAPGKDARINLGYYQLNFFAQDDWRVRSNLSVSYGVRYEYNTPPNEADHKIEDTFAAPLAPQVAGFAAFIDGRKRIFDPDRNNFAPRFSVAFAPSPSTAIRGGYGLYYDQILGAVVSQSRNVYPTFTTVNFGGGFPCYLFQATPPVQCPFTTVLGPTNGGFIFNMLTPPNNPAAPSVVPGTLNTSAIGTSSGVPLAALAALVPFNQSGSLANGVSSGSPFGATLPTRKLDIPMSHQYFIGVEHQLFNSNTFLSVSYVGTTGRNLLRFTTPNLGSNYILRVNEIALITFPDQPNYFSSVPTLRGFSYDPSTSVASVLNGSGRPVDNVGPISQFETTGRSQYHSFQTELRGRLSTTFSYRVSYTLAKAKDDVSDVFDLAGSPALPQNSRNLEGEYGTSNFDVRHKIAYAISYDLPSLKDQGPVVSALLGGWQIASTGRFHTGQPFTVNSIYDVNLDGNLTDRLNNASLISRNDGNNAAVLINSATTPAQLQSMLAAVGSDGSLPRNSFRGRSLLDLDVSFSKRFRFTESQGLQFRVDVFNFIDRTNFAIPVRFLESPGFGSSVDTVTPGRRVQFALKYSF